MAEQLIYELEKAAQVVLAPPNLITIEQHRSAEEVFLNFRKLKSPYELCRHILETNTNDYILFEAAGLIRIALIREWPSLPESDISSLREYLLHYVMGKPNLAPYVKGCIIQVIVIIIKRASVNDSGQARQRILGEMEYLILSGDLPMKLLGCNIIFAMMQEFANNSKSSNIGLTWTIHLEEKKSFQAVDMKRIFQFCIRLIDELNKKDLEEDGITLLKQLLPIVENVFTWAYIDLQNTNIPFITKYFQNFNSIALPHLDSDCDTISTTDLSLDDDWQDIMLVPATLDSMFTLYWKIRGNPQLAHHARTCLVQMATLNGSIMPTGQMKVQYLTNYLERFLKFVASITINDEEAIGIVNIVTKLYTFFETNFPSLPGNMMTSFMDLLSQLTCIFLEGAAQEESSSLGESFYTEALDTLFETWACILYERNLDPTEFSKDISAKIFKVYLLCHLSPPEGVRSIADADLKKEESELEEADRFKFIERLQIIGKFGRQISNYSLPLLGQLLEGRTSKLRENLNKFVGQTELLSTTKTDFMPTLYEDLHWLIIIIGNTLCTDVEGEASLIPSEIITYDMEQVQQGKVDIDLTLQYLASSENVSSSNVASESVDHVIRLVADIFHLCAIEKTAVSVQLNNLLSPELSCSIMWFLNKWFIHYLLPVEYCYDKISIVFMQAFGRNTSGALWATNFLLDKIEFNINAFKSEPAVMEETIKLLTTLVKSAHHARCVLETRRFGSIINLAIKEHYDFSKLVRVGLMQAVIQIGFTCPSRIGQSYWTQVLKPLVDRCKRITSDEKFLQSYHQENIKIQIIHILESFIGVARAVQNSETETLFQYMQPVLYEQPNLLSLYHNYQEIVELILELLFECTKGTESILGHLTRVVSPQMYEICLSAIQNYTRCNSNRLTIDSTAEEDSYQDILLLLKLLTNLLRKRLLLDKTVSVVPVDAFLCGFSVIMPIMTTDLLKFPLLCQHYFQMIVYLCELYPQKVLSLSPELLQPLFASVELGLFSFGHDVYLSCCSIIHILMKRIYNDVQNGSPANQILAPFLNVLITIIISHHIEYDFVLKLFEPLYYLIYCYPDEYKRIVQNVLSTQTDQDVVQRLADAFGDINVQNRKACGRNFDKFVSSVQGLLVIK